MNIVDGDSEYDRVAFEFTNAIALVWGKEVQLPRIGTGWFDTMFCNETLNFESRFKGRLECLSKDGVICAEEKYGFSGCFFSNWHCRI